MRLVTIGQGPPDDRNAGVSKCPICGTEWLVTPYRDCMMPRCGDFGTDSSAANPSRPCEPCGLKHALSCPECQ